MMNVSLSARGMIEGGLYAVVSPPWGACLIPCVPCTCIDACYQLGPDMLSWKPTSPVIKSNLISQCSFETSEKYSRI